MLKWTKWYIALSILNLLDCLTTCLAIRTGIFKELNPFMAWAIHQSIWLFIAIKVGLIPFCWPALTQANKGNKSSQRTIKILTYVFGAIVLSNSVQLLLYLFKSGIFQHMI